MEKVIPCVTVDISAENVFLLSLVEGVSVCPWRFLPLFFLIVLKLILVCVCRGWAVGCPVCWVSPFPRGCLVWKCYIIASSTYYCLTKIDFLSISFLLRSNCGVPLVVHGFEWHWESCRWLVGLLLGWIRRPRVSLYLMRTLQEFRLCGLSSASQGRGMLFLGV
jgi:hypothetical protein